MARSHACAAGLLACAVMLGSGCSWSRFDDVSKDAPVLLLKRPGSLNSGFGYGIATVTPHDGITELISAGAPGHQGAAVFVLGKSDQPRLDATDTAQCKGDQDPCYLASSLAGIVRPNSDPQPQPEHCFVSGIGRGFEQSFNGLITRCDDGTEYALEVPPKAKSQLVDPAIANGVPDVVVLDSDKAEDPALIAGGPSKRFAWFYAPGSNTPVELVPPGNGAEAGFGSAVASLRIGTGAQRIFAVSAPDHGHVWLFRTDDGVSVHSIGCLGGPSGFGRALGAGFVDKTDADDELVVADASEVSVFDGAALASLPPTSSATCGLSSLPAGALVASFGCGATPAVSGCGSSDFGASVAVADLDGDGDGEVIVGAPLMTARGVSRAGAVLIFDAEGDDPYHLSDVKFISSAEEGDQLGAFVTAARIGTRDIIAAGAPGTGKTALFYCTTLLPADKRGARCQ